MLLALGLALASQVGCQGALWSCDDGQMNGPETGPDCGGSLCGPCAVGLGCLRARDCESGRCVGKVCLPGGTCADRITDGTESDVDCGGGGCTPCDTGRRCARDADCASAVCAAGVCVLANCGDGRRDGTESDVYCGGGVCPACLDGAACNAGGDCASVICSAHLCLATLCGDGLADGDESDVDCGGGTCPQCGVGGACSVPTDCQSSRCEGGRCAAVAAMCSLGYKPDAQNLCVCDPATCGACCNVDEGNVCGLNYQPGMNNCGVAGQACFLCDAALGRNCEHAQNGPDYCALACDAGPCAGCCSGPQNQFKSYCLLGTEDVACGVDGAHCQVCQPNERCQGGKCVRIQ